MRGDTKTADAREYAGNFTNVCEYAPVVLLIWELVQFANLSEKLLQISLGSLSPDTNMSLTGWRTNAGTVPAFN